MTADNRSVHTDALATLGMLLDGGQARDAIHIAVEPVVAGQRLLPGDHVGFTAPDTVGRFAEKLVGIIDPFYDGVVNEGDRVWLLVYPRQITSLRHVWEHPAFKPSSDDGAGFVRLEALIVAESEAFMRREAERLDCGYNELIEAAREYERRGEYFSKPQFEGERLSPGFWDHWERLTGEKATGDRDHFLTCSCG